MKRSMITGLAVAGVVGSAGAAFAGVAANDSGTPSAQAQGPAPTSAQAAPAPEAGTGLHDRTIQYQVGAAGTVAVTVSGPTLAVTNVTAGTGWSVVGAGGPAAHLEVQFTDTLQLVTFSADLVGDEVVVAVTNAPAAGAPTTSVAPDPMAVTVITAPRPAGSTPAPQPATPPATGSVAPPTSAHGNDDHGDDDHDDDSSHTAPGTVPSTPAPSATTAPSGGGSEVGDDDGDDHDDDHDSDDHDDDHEDHEDD